MTVLKEEVFVKANDKSITLNEIDFKLLLLL